MAEVSKQRRRENALMKGRNTGRTVTEKGHVLFYMSPKASTRPENRVQFEIRKSFLTDRIVPL